MITGGAASLTIFASWYCTMKPLTTSGKGSVSVAGKHPLKRCRLPCTYICHRNLTKNLFLKIWSDLQVNDVTLCIHGVFTKSDIHILIVDFQKVPEFDIYTLALLLKKVSLPLFCLAFGPESTFLFSLLVTLPVFIIDL